MSKISSGPKDEAVIPFSKGRGGLGRSWSRMRRSDKALLTFFCILLVTMVIIVLISYPYSSLEDLLILFPLLGGFVAVFFLTGIPALAIYLRKGQVSTVWLLLTLAIISFVYMLSLNITNGNDKLPSPFMDHGVPGHLVFFFVYALAFLVLYIFVAFGMMWLLTFGQRQSVPENLDDIKGITAYRSSKDHSWRDLWYWKVMMLTFAFNIPDVLDTRTLRVKVGKRRKGFPISEFLPAFGWNMVIGMFITMLITLNPFLKDMPAFQNVFGLSEFISFFIPLLVLSLFIFKRVDARIKGQVKDFRLFDGLRSRMTRSVLAVSTLIIFIRLAVQSIDQQMLLKFYEMFIDFTAVVIITTFVYFNYFEEDAAMDIEKNWKGDVPAKKGPVK